MVEPEISVSKRARERIRPLTRFRRYGRRAGEALFLILIAVLVSLTGYAAFANYLLEGWSANAAGWAQASGSIIAIAGAAWLARGEIRHAKRWRRDLAEEAAWSVRFAIRQAQFDSQIIAAELTAPDATIDTTTIRSWRQRAANCSITLQAMLTRIDHVHPLVVTSASNAKVLVDGLTEDIEKLGQLVQRHETVSDDLRGDIVFVHANLSKLVELYDERMLAVTQALDRGGDMLPLGEFSTSRARSAGGQS